MISPFNEFIRFPRRPTLPPIFSDAEFDPMKSAQYEVVSMKRQMWAVDGDVKGTPIYYTDPKTKFKGIIPLTPVRKRSMKDEEKVKAKWPDAEISTAFAVQKDGTRRWMYCVMSSLKFRASPVKKRVCNVGPWRYSEVNAWADAAHGS